MTCTTRRTSASIAAICHGGVERHHARAHAVDQQARRVVGGAQKIGILQRHPQHRHLQTRETTPNARWDALFRQR